MKQRARVAVGGAVQGVGFRPFIYRLAVEMGLTGWVLNSPQGVSIEVEGEKKTLDAFVLRIERERPPRSYIQSLECSFLDPAGYAGFEIRGSDGLGGRTAWVLPDSATCPDCLREILDPKNRRYLYPFTNCTNCGPRFSIMESLPYDRAGTSMKGFVMCAACRREYEDPLDRRFHAQPNACPVCGPRLKLWDERGDGLAAEHEALCRAAAAIEAGKIVAVKGLGGFHLLVDARSDGAVARLRKLKRREEKPLAVMAPDLAAVKECCQVSSFEERLLLSPECPVVLLRRKDPAANSSLSPRIAPRNPYLGVMLPYTPLHHLLLGRLGFLVVATSGNLTDEPICTDEHEAVERLHGIADCFLVHNRPIVRHVDDSVVRVMMGRELVLRRARGYAPLPVRVKDAAPGLLAVGGQLKNAVAVTGDAEVFISQHIGDLETEAALRAFQEVIHSFGRLYGLRPEIFLCDLHPDYLATKFARAKAPSVHGIQHHFAHVASCMAENELDGPVLGVAWDGTGYGPDGTVWGGEFLLTDGATFRRAASLRPFRLPGGDKAIREPRRTALGLLYELYGTGTFEMPRLEPQRAFSGGELKIFAQMLSRGVNAPLTSSVGRLFDAVSSLLGLCQRAHFEGQAAMELEFAADPFPTEEVYPFQLVAAGGNGSLHGPAMVIDWAPMLRALLADLEGNEPAGRIAAKFHNTLADVIVATALRVGEERVVLTGGCFQNRLLSERAISRLAARGFRPYWHQRVPPNDGGIALGQIFAWHQAHRRSTGDEVRDSAREARGEFGGVRCA